MTAYWMEKYVLKFHEAFQNETGMYYGDSEYWDQYEEWMDNEYDEREEEIHWFQIQTDIENIAISARAHQHR